jgi:hypothetical protein
VFLIDVTRHIGLVQHVVGAAQAYASQFNPEIIEWFIKPGQASAMSVDGTQLHRISYGASPWLSIKARIESLAANGSSDLFFHVLSYDGPVLGEAARFGNATVAVSSLCLSTLKTAKEEAAPQKTPPSTSQSATLDEWINLSKRALAENHYDSPERALKQLFLRPLLAKYDLRARKNPYDPNSALLISNIVSDGLSKGWLGRSRQNEKSGTERIWLAGKESIPTPSTPPEAGVTIAPSSSNVQPSAEPPVTEVTPVEKGHKRTVQMQECLKHRFVYSPKLIRDYIFAALRSRMGELPTKPVSVSQLLREAGTEAEKSAVSENVTFEHWPSALSGVLENLVAAGAFLDEKTKRIQPGPQARGTKVHEIVADFEDACEAYLLEYLISALGDVTWPTDRTAVAHALFKVGPSRKEVYELQERVDELLVRLQDRVVEKSNGRLAVEKVK